MSLAANLRNVLGQAAAALDGRAEEHGLRAVLARLEDAIAGGDAEQHALDTLAGAFGGAAPVPAPVAVPEPAPVPVPAPEPVAAPAADTAPPEAIPAPVAPAEVTQP